MRLSKWMFSAAAICAVTLLAAFIGISVSIATGVRDAAAAAVGEYGGDATTALMAVVDSPTHPLRERNRAVWALGQLGDARALPVLERYYTGQPCDHARLICQHELDKAIRLCRGAHNATAAFRFVP